MSAPDLVVGALPTAAVGGTLEYEEGAIEPEMEVGADPDPGEGVGAAGVGTAQCFACLMGVDAEGDGGMGV